MAAWSKWEIEFLVQNYRTMNLNQISSMLGRTPRSIEQKAYKLNINKTYKWTEEDITFLIENYDSMSNTELAKKLSRTVGAIERKAKFFNLRKSKDTINSIKRKWTLEKISFLKDNYKKMPPSEICANLGINLGTLYRMAGYYGLRENAKGFNFHTNTNCLWTEEEVRFLQKNYIKMTQQELADKLKRTKQSIQKKMFYEGFKKCIRNPIWSEHDIHYLKTNYENGLMIQMSNYLNRSFKAIHTKANELNLNRDVSTYIEREVEEILIYHTIKFEKQVNIRGFIADFVLLNKKVIEVQGDYWHCNPHIYDEPQNVIQTKKLKQDKMKRGCFNELGYRILYIWELDLNNNYDQVVKEIRQFAVL